MTRISPRVKSGHVRSSFDPDHESRNSCNIHHERANAGWTLSSLHCPCSARATQCVPTPSGARITPQRLVTFPHCASAQQHSNSPFLDRSSLLRFFHSCHRLFCERQHRFVPDCSSSAPGQPRCKPLPCLPERQSTVSERHARAGPMAH